MVMLLLKSYTNFRVFVVINPRFLLYTAGTKVYLVKDEGIC